MNDYTFENMEKAIDQDELTIIENTILIDFANNEIPCRTIFSEIDATGASISLFCDFEKRWVLEYNSKTDEYALYKHLAKPYELLETLVHEAQKEMNFEILK